MLSELTSVVQINRTGLLKSTNINGIEVVCATVSFRKDNVAYTQRSKAIAFGSTARTLSRLAEGSLAQISYSVNKDGITITDCYSVSHKQAIAA